MNTYLVYRPYCTPAKVVVIEKSKKAAVKLVHKTYGYASDTKVKLKTKPGVILALPAIVNIPFSVVRQW